MSNMSESASASATTVYKGIKNIDCLKLLASEPIAVTVGTAASAKTWHLPKDLLIKSSPFFAAALNGSFAEAKSKVVNLPEDDADAFAFFVQWLYVGEINSDDCTADHDHTSHLCREATAGTLTQAWILGDKLGSSIFKDVAMLGLHKTSADMSIEADIVLARTAYERSAPRSKLRKFAIDQFRYDLRFYELDEEFDAHVSAAMIVEGFGLDFLKTCVKAVGAGAINPAAHKQRYMQVLTVTEQE